MGQNMGQIVRQQNFQRSPNLISICVDEIRNGELSGRLYHCYSEEACPFSNVAHLIELAENLFDQNSPGDRQEAVRAVSVLLPSKRIPWP